MINYIKIKSSSTFKDEAIDVIDTLIMDQSIITYEINIKDYSSAEFNIYKIRLFRVEQSIELDDKVYLKFSTESGEIIHRIKDTNEFYDITDLIDNKNIILRLELMRDTPCTRIDSITLKCYTIDCDDPSIDIKEGCDDYTGIPVSQYHSSHSDTNLSPYLTKENYLQNDSSDIPGGYMINDTREFNIDLKYFNNTITQEQYTLVNILFNPKIIKKDYVDHWSTPVKKTYITDKQLKFRVYDKSNNIYLNEYSYLDVNKHNGYHIYIDPTILSKNTLYTLEFFDGQYVWKDHKYNFSI